jgi:hypothetical protein
MSRFRTYSDGDDPPITDGDVQFKGIVSRVQGAAVPPGYLSEGSNVRMDYGTVRPRKGCTPLTTEFFPYGLGLQLPFQLAAPVSGTVTGYGSGNAVVIAFDAPHGYVVGSVHRLMATGDVSISSTLFEVVDADTMRSLDYEIIPTGSPPYEIDIYVDYPVLYGDSNELGTSYCEVSSSTWGDGILIATLNAAYLYRPGEDMETVLYRSALGYPVALSAGEALSMTQFLNTVFMFRGRGAGVSYKWDMGLTSDFAPVSSSPLSGTLIPMPEGMDWGVHFVNRLWLPYQTDELIGSDIGDPYSYDTVYTQLKIMQGAADYLVGVHPFQDLQLLVMYRRSIHLLQLASDLTLSEAKEITREVGCAARKTIQTCGDAVLWLSDNGVQALQISDFIKLKGTPATVSMDIDDVIQRINWTRAQHATAKYYNNRYFLAVPLDDSQYNNAVLVYNFLNKAWESVDTYPDDFDAVDFCVITYGNRKRLFAGSSKGCLFLLEKSDTSDVTGPEESVTETSLESYAITRSYARSDLEAKRFQRGLAEVVENTSDTYQVQLIAEAPAKTHTCLTVVAAEDKTAARRFSTGGVRGLSAKFKFITSAGRPELRAITIEGRALGRSNLSN